MIAKVSVTGDGTWQKRGHSFKIGIVFVIGLNRRSFGLYFKSLVCHTCMKHQQQDDKASKDYINWWELHKPSCLINHSGSSNSMEREGACEIFLRSIEKNSLKYCPFVGDGDTGSYGKVRGRLAEAFGKKYIVGHVQKRLGSGLRELKRKQRGTKLSDGKVIGGKGRLTDKIIDKIPKLF